MESSIFTKYNFSQTSCSDNIAICRSSNKLKYIYDPKEKLVIKCSVDFDIYSVDDH